MAVTKSIDEFLLDDWLDLRLKMNAVAFKRKVSLASAAGIEVPMCVMAGIRVPNVTFVTESETARYNRMLDTDKVNQFNAKVKAWAKEVESMLRSSASSSFSHTGKGPHLPDTIRSAVRYDKKYKTEAVSVGFTFARHGIYRHYGAYRGYGGLSGSQWTDKYGTLKHASSESLGKMGSGNVTPVDWFNPVIRSHVDALSDIVADYCADMTINLSQLFLPE